MPTTSTNTTTPRGELNPDPITGEPGAHPIGTGVGAAAAGAMGALIGSAGGPVGAAVGAVIGAVTGAYGGKAVAEAIDPTAEDAYWRKNHPAQPYATDGRDYEDYAPAYRAGYTGFRDNQTFEERELDLRTGYEAGLQKPLADVDPAAVPGTMQNNQSTNPLRWDVAREAARAAFERRRRSETQRAQGSVQ